MIIVDIVKNTKAVLKKKSNILAEQLFKNKQI